jgi:hypothetical protein
MKQDSSVWTSTLRPTFEHGTVVSSDTVVPAVFVRLNTNFGVCGGVVGGRSRVRFPMSLKFFINVYLPAALWSWDRLGLLRE